MNLDTPEVYPMLIHFTPQQIVIAVAAFVVVTFGLRGVIRSTSVLVGFAALAVLVFYGLIFMAKYIFNSAF
jgi:hypothetical protein